MSQPLSRGEQTCTAEKQVVDAFVLVFLLRMQRRHTALPLLAILHCTEPVAPLPSDHHSSLYQAQARAHERALMSRKTHSPQAAQRCN
jgi:hypothetical protein